MDSKIFVYRPHDEYLDAVGVAFAEDGDEIAFHVSSNLSFFRLDMGLTSEYKHDKYKAKYPDGYELVEVIGREQMDHYIQSGQLKNVEWLRVSHKKVEKD